MTAITALPRYILVFSVLALILLPMQVQANPRPIEQVTIAADEPLSIILMIGDGMGFEHVELARLVEEGEAGLLVMQQLTWNASMTTFSADDPITDSAAAGTAIATGTKTNKRYIGINPAGHGLETILEYAQTLNKSTGVVSTCRVIDATPASFMTHVNNRYEFDEIVRQIIEEADVDVLLGGGLDYFSSDNLTTMESNGYTMVYDRTSMMNVASGRIFGLFADVHMSYELDRNYANTPSIAEMTNKSIELLSQDADGFFLMVEGGRIDLAAHDDDKVRNALDTIAFDNAVQIALDYVQENNNTILIVTADHETEGLVVLSHDLNSTLPGSVSTHNEKEAVRIERVNNISVSWTADYHTATNVPLFGYGSAFEDLPIDTIVDNTNVYFFMKDYYDGNPLSIVPYTPPATTTTSTTTTTSPTLPAPPLDATIIVIASVSVIVVVVIAVVVFKKR